MLLYLSRHLGGKKNSLCLKASERAGRTDVRAETGKVVDNSWHSWRTSSWLLLVLRGELSRALAGCVLSLQPIQISSTAIVSGKSHLLRQPYIEWIQ